MMQGSTLDYANEFQQDFSRLEGLFRSMFNEQGETPTSNVIISRALDILRLHPQLCLEEFSIRVRPMITMAYIPLKIFLRAGADLQVIQEICDLEPAALLHDGDSGNLALHFACYRCALDSAEGAHQQQQQGSICEETVVFLAQKCPFALKRKDQHNNFPLSIALRIHMSLNTIRALLDTYPPILNGCHDDKHGSVPVGTAITYNCSMEVIDLLSERLLLSLPRSYHAQTLTLCTVRTGRLTGRPSRQYAGTPIDLNYSKTLVKLLLPQFARILFRFDDWTDDGLAYFLTHLQTKKSIFAIQELSLPYNLIATSLELQRLVRTCFQKIMGVERMCITRCPYDARGHDDVPFLQAIGSGVLDNKCANPQLEIKNLRLPDIQCLIDFLLSDSAPPKLHLSDLDLVGDPCDQIQEYDGIPSRLQHFTLTNATFPHHACYDSLLNRLAHLPSLKTLHWVYAASFKNTAPDVTTALVFLIRRTNSLESLTLKWVEFDHERICLALRQNATIKAFHTEDRGVVTLFKDKHQYYREMVEKHNTTLTKLAEGIILYDADIAYYLSLNKYGRAQARNPAITPSQWCAIISNVVSSRSAGLHNMKVDVLFGLLSESPDTWCNVLDTADRRPG